MKILNATYGNKDVTEIVNSCIIDNKLDIKVSNDIFGDPEPFKIKYLKLEYEDDNKIKNNTYIENSMCNLPIVKKNKKIKYIIPLPDSKYYLWQVLVQINNFRKIGYEIDAHYPVCYFNEPSEILKIISNSNEIKSNFHLYKDTRENKVYAASMKPWAVSQYFKEFPEEYDCVYIYLDPDVIFLKPMDWSPFVDDDIWYESDTSSYLDSKYIKSKGEQLFVEMCEIVGVSPDVVMYNDKNCGGAQYITKNNTYDFWREVEMTSGPLYKHMVDTAEKYKPENDPYSIQAWTSEMWTTNWVLWKNGVETKCVPELEFHWANHKIENLKHIIYHNAGVVDDDGEHFSKTIYQKSPFNKELKGKTDSISYKYIEEIKETELNFANLVSKF